MMPDPIGEAVRHVECGGLLAYPTETVWGLGADVADAAALALLRQWKGRADDEPMAVLLESAAAAEDLDLEFGAAARLLAEAFWPGPLTLVVPCAQTFGPGVARADGAVGLRCSSHPLAIALARRMRREGIGPVTATSLNRSGEAAADRAEDARALCGEGGAAPHMVDVQGAECGGDRASTVIDLTSGTLEVLRFGALGEDDLAPVLRELAAQ